MIVHGIDASLTGTCVFDGVNFLYLKNVGSSKEPIARVIEIRDQVMNYVRYADEVWLEDYAFNSRGNQAHSIGELGGVLKVALLEAGIPTRLVKPNVRAKFGCGKGNAGKDAVVAAVAARTGVPFETNDHCDAYVLHCMGLQYHEEAHPMGDLPKTHLAALDKEPVLLG